jgi:hypothetical protein
MSVVELRAWARRPDRAAVYLYPEKGAAHVRFAYCPSCPENVCKGHLLRVWGEAS